MVKILILTSNPRQDLKQVYREVGDLIAEIQHLGSFDIKYGFEVRSQELQYLLCEYHPQIVHYCGHGAGEGGLVLQNAEGREQLFPTELLAQIFNTFSNEIKCAVLNACDSDHQAEVIVEYINYVIGMNQPILDKAAYYFSVGFYTGLANGESIERSHKIGCNAIQTWETESQSKQYRKAEYAGGVVQSAPQLAEHKKPVLRINRRLLPSTSAEIGSVQKASLGSAMPDYSRDDEWLKQVIDRKEYKDYTREAYDNFGQFSAKKATNLTEPEREQRKILVGKVKQFWIEGFLEPSLQDNPTMRLGLEARPDAIADLSEGIEALSVDLDKSHEELRETRIYEEMGQGRTLLILGDPGAGKTIALLQLAERLIKRSEHNLRLPMPVVFNLSSWAKEQQSLVDWLIDELLEKYQVPKSLSEPWITNQQLILLLDGLDEVLEDYRNDCVRALNEFIAVFPQTEMAVCSRVKDYEALTERLQLSSALCLQPLSAEQMYQFLDDVGGSLAGLKALLKSDAELKQFAQTPLIVNFMSVAYQGWSAQELIPQLRTPARHRHLFDTYIDRRIEQGATSKYSKDKVLRWLSWLASRIVQEKQTIFLIEKMQPTWLKNGREESFYRNTASVIGGLSFWLIGVLIAGLFKGPFKGLIYGLSCGLSCWGFFELISGLITGSLMKISPLEQPSWSWQRAKSRFVSEFSTGVRYGLLAGASGVLTHVLTHVLTGVLTGVLSSELMNWLKFGLSDRLIYGLIYELIYGLGFGLILGLIFGLGSGLYSSEIVQRTVPNQGICTSLRNCLFIGLIAGLLIAGLLIAGLNGGLNGGLSFGLSFGLISALKYGGAACIQHFTLRWMLNQKNRIPWNYAKFLDFASDRRLMKKVGGGYVFFHRMLLEHFAQMNHN